MAISLTSAIPSTVKNAEYAVNAGHAGSADNATNATNANYATSAGSATNATDATNATNATNSTYAERANYLKDRTDGSSTYSNYGAAGLDYGSYTWLAGWNGHELRAIHKSQYAQKSGFSLSGSTLRINL